MRVIAWTDLDVHAWPKQYPVVDPDRMGFAVDHDFGAAAFQLTLERIEGSIGTADVAGILQEVKRLRRITERLS